MSSRTRRGIPPLPEGFVTVQGLLDGDKDPGTIVNVVGIVNDFRAPVQTRRDWKMTATIYDLSTQESGQGIDVVFFRRTETEMPKLDAGDILLAVSIKVQKYSGNISLITTHPTVAHVYAREMVPKPPGSAAVALKNSRSGARQPTPKHNEYVSYLCANIDTYMLPDEDCFQERVSASVHVKDKFSTLDKISDYKFFDLIVRVVKQFHDSGHSITFWVSDYTSNDRFFDKQPDGARASDGDGELDSDPYGYLAKYRKPSSSQEESESFSSCLRPCGKMSLQISCWEPHAEFIRGNVRVGEWIRLRNVQIKYGHLGSNLEGFLRSHKDYPSRISVENLDPKLHRDPRFEAALQRQRDYEKKNKQQGSELRAISQAAGHRRDEALREKTALPAAKRQPDQGDTGLPSKKRRQQEREAKRMAEDREEKLQQEQALGLNSLVKCENHTREASALSELLKPVHYEVKIEHKYDVRFQLPFTNVKYRTIVRVVDFRPNDLKDFAQYCGKPKYDDSDSSDDDLTSSEAEDDASSRAWEWRFSLLLEDAGVNKPKGQAAAPVWVVVNNADAQYLSLEDAVDLRRDSEALDALREKMFTLWGNLEEIKCKQRKSQRASAKNQHLSMPPLSSNSSDVTPGGQLSNKPFTCCIKQYGVKVKTNNPAEADAGVGRKWERVFGLYGTKICC